MQGDTQSEHGQGSAAREHGVRVRFEERSRRKCPPGGFCGRRGEDCRSDRSPDAGGESPVHRVRRDSGLEQLRTSDGTILGVGQGIEDSVGVVTGPFHAAMMSIRAADVIGRSSKVDHMVDRRGD